ncbi:neocarzinostatin apoprotein domain-containing protein [Streptomyces sp. NPDC054961]
MTSGRTGPRGGRAGVLARGAVTLALACTGLAAGPGPVAAQAAAGRAGAVCGADATATGTASRAVPGSLVSVDRGDGRISQVQLFYDGTADDGTADGGPSFVWHREQEAPASAFGPWQRVSGAGARPGGRRSIGAAENAAGGLEVLFAGDGSYCRTVENGGAHGGWSTPEAVGPDRSGERIGPNPVEELPDGRLRRTPRGTDGAGAAGRPAALAASGSGPRLDVGRTTGLLDGDIVTFGIAGGPPKAYVWVKQCGPQASATTCDDATGRQFRVQPDGTHPLSPKKLYAQLDTPAGKFDCRTASDGSPCSLALTDNEGTVLATVALRFRPDGRPEAPPTLRVSPDRGLVDGRTVRARGRGFEPRYHALVMECAAGSADTLGCRPRGRPPASDDDGRVDEEITVSATFTGIDGRTVDCRVRGACELVVFGIRVRGPESVRHPLEFAPAAPS